jgi:hypothetical protein
LSLGNPKVEVRHMSHELMTILSGEFLDSIRKQSRDVGRIGENESPSVAGAEAA